MYFNPHSNRTNIHIHTNELKYCSADNLFLYRCCTCSIPSYTGYPQNVPTRKSSPGWNQWYLQFALIENILSQQQSRYQAYGYRYAEYVESEMKNYLFICLSGILFDVENKYNSICINSVYSFISSILPTCDELTFPITILRSSEFMDKFLLPIMPSF